MRSSSLGKPDTYPPSSATILLDKCPGLKYNAFRYFIRMMKSIFRNTESEW